MWEIVGPAQAEFRANGWLFGVSASSAVPSEQGGGVRFGVSRQRECGGDAGCLRGPCDAGVWLPGHPLPPWDECFVRGDSLHLSFPVSPGHPVGLHVVLLAVEADPERLVIESVLAVETESLESFPELHLVAAPSVAVTASSPNVADGSAASDRTATDEDGASVVWQPSPVAGTDDDGTIQQPLQTTVICDSRDHSSLATGWDASDARIRFWGDFLEKGVTRKVQPWWVWSTTALSSEATERLTQRLAARPLPLFS